MALESLPATSPVPAPTGTAPGVVPAPPGANVPAALTPDFLQILAGAIGGAAPASSEEVTVEIEIKSPKGTAIDDDTLEDEIGFEDLSEFLTQVIVPSITPPAPAPAPADGETTLEMDFTDSGAASRPADLAALISSLSGDARSAKPDPIAALDTSLLRDALEAESTVAAALADVASDSTTFADTLDSQSGSVSPLHAASLHAAHANSQSAAPEQLKSPVGTQQWADELGTKLTWMVQQGRESASLTVTPEHLGPIEVKISVQDGQTSVWFNATNADTRTAIEQALPRLRDLFAAQGLSLADSGVFREAPRHQQPQPFSGASGSASHGDEITAVSSVTKRGNGILDLYA
jgi:flagellar hook-length control protein FliK